MYHFVGWPKEGIAVVRVKGKKLERLKGKLGRSKLDGKENEIRKFLKKGV